MPTRFSPEAVEIARTNPLAVVTKGVTLIRHIPEIIPHFYLPVRDHVLSDTRPEVINGLLEAYTGSGKRLLAGQLMYLFDHDPYAMVTQEQMGIKIKQRYVSFASAAVLAKRRRVVPSVDDQGKPLRGSYTTEQYPKITGVMVGDYEANYVSTDHREINWCEPSGPDVLHLPDGTKEGNDRGQSFTEHLAEHHRDTTHVLTIRRGADLYQYIVDFRTDLGALTTDNLPEFMAKFHLKFLTGIAYERLGEGLKRAWVEQLKDSGASAKGVIRSNVEQQTFMTRLGLSDDEFWPVFNGPAHKRTTTDGLEVPFGLNFRPNFLGTVHNPLLAGVELELYANLLRDNDLYLKQEDIELQSAMEQATRHQRMMSDYLPLLKKVYGPTATLQEVMDALDGRNIK